MQVQFAVRGLLGRAASGLTTGLDGLLVLGLNGRLNTGLSGLTNLGSGGCPDLSCPGFFCLASFVCTQI